VGEPLISQRMTKSYQQKNYGYTILDSLNAHHNIQVLKGNWPFVNMGEEIDYEKIYQPKNFLDSIAFEVTKNTKLSLGTARYELAKKYDESGEYYKAFKEYEAIIRTAPYIAHIYRDAATALINLSDLPMALNYFKKSLEFEESGFAYFKMAEIYYYMGDYNSTVNCLQNSYPLIPEERRVLALAQTYSALVYGNHESAAQEVANELKKLNAENYLNIPPKKYMYNQFIPYQTSEMVIEAKELLSENKNEEALQLLLTSLNTYDSHIAKRLIGETYLRQQNIGLALNYHDMVYEQFRFDPNFLYNLAVLYHFENDSAKANKCLEELTLLEPSFYALEQLKSILSQTN
jgi:tetratricopeptide (TPR) repeat protein